MEAHEAYARLELPRERAHISVKPAEGQFMHDWIRRHGLSRTLEIGFAYGGSAVCILSAHDGPHTCIDPYQDQEYGNLGLRNVRAFGFEPRLRLLPDFSHNALPQLLAEKQQFDFVFIDGSHRYDGIMIDFYYVDLLLAPRGYVALHDTWMRSTQMVASFIRSNRRDYRPLPCPVGNMTLFQKTGADERNWDHFHEFYTWKGILSQPLIKLVNRFRPQARAA